MKRKLFLGTAALVLAAVGVFAGRTSKKFFTIATLYYKISTGNCTFASNISNSTAFLTATSGFDFQASVKTATNGVATGLLFYTSTCSSASAVYFKP